MEKDVILELKNITKIYPGVVALNNVSLDFRKGEVHALLGENGAGKSTLIKSIAGAIEPDGGVFCIDGQEHTKMSPELSKALGISVVYQEFNACVFSNLSIAENLGISSMKTMSSGWFVKNRMLKYIEKEFRETYEINSNVKEVADLNEKEKYALLFRRFALSKAKILIVENPWTYNDEAVCGFIMEELLKIANMGAAVLLVTNNYSDYCNVCNKVFNYLI